jgi:hypothetical protein
MIIPSHSYTPREATVCGILAGTDFGHGSTMLNVGMRQPEDLRNWWWIKICQANEVMPFVLEVFRPNVDRLVQHGVPNVHEGDVRCFSQCFERSFDIILWWHGPEHVEKNSSIACIRTLQAKCRLLILGSPWGPYPQDAIDGNVHELFGDN